MALKKLLLSLTFLFLTVMGAGSAQAQVTGCPIGSTTILGCYKVDGTTITVSGGTITAIGAAAGSISVGVTTVGSGTSPFLLYDNGGVLGNESFASACTAATTGAFGCVKVDGSTITISGGVISVLSGGSVSSVSNSDSSLTISPTTGAVVASLNVGHANTWTATQTFSGANIALGTNSLTGNFTISGAPLMTGLSNGTPATTLNLDSGNNVVKAALTAGSGITITPSSGALTISATGGGAPSFTSISNGTNTTAAMVVGAGASLNFTSSGTINASTLLGNTWAAPGTIGGTTPGTGNFSSLVMTGNIGLSTNQITGNFTVAGVPIFTGLSNGTPATTLNLDASNNLVKAAITAGTGITVTPSSGAITISATGSSVSITAGTPNIVVTPSPLTGTGTVGTTNAQNTQSGNSPYAIQSSDAAKEILRTNTVTQTDTIPQATGNFGAGFSTTYTTKTIGNSISPSAGSVINGLSSALVLGAYQGISIDSDGANYRVLLGVPQPPTQAGVNFLRDDFTWTTPPTASTSVLGLVKVDGSTITISSGVISAIGGAATSITVGTTTVGSGVSGDLLFDNGGVLGNETFAAACTSATAAAFGCIKVDNATITESAGVISAEGANYYIPNAGSTGTTVNKLAKVTGAPSTAVITATTDSPSSTALGIVTAGAGTSGTATIQYSGVATCVFDGATVAGHPVQLSTTTAGDCHDPGSITPSSGQIVGVVLGTIGAAGNAPIALNIPPVNANILNIHSASIGWIAGVTPSGGILTVYQPSTILDIRGRVETAVGSAATISLFKAPSGTPCGSGTNLISGSGTFNANGTAATNQILNVGTTALSAGDTVCTTSTGTYSGASGNGDLTIYYTTP